MACKRCGAAHGYGGQAALGRPRAGR
jgi:hypothetical protein